MASSSGAQPPLVFLPPNFDPKVLWLTKTLLPLWMRWRSNIRRIHIEGLDTLVDLYHDFQNQQVRFLLAFRHPTPNDPYCLLHLTSHAVPNRAKALGIPLRQPLHVHFIYDRGIPLWAGKAVGWLYQKLGGIPIQRGKVDRQGLKTARHLLAQGRFPMAAAPEGGNNGHSEIVSPLEPGIAQMGFWCVEDLHKGDRGSKREREGELKAAKAEPGKPPKVVIVPLGIRYQYLTPPWGALVQLLSQLEQDCGLPSPPAPPVSTDPVDPTMIGAFYPRLITLGLHLLTLMEGYYREFYHAELPVGAKDAADSLAERLNTLLDTALQVAETFFQLAPKGTVIERCRRIEQAGWDRIYREEWRDVRTLSEVERGLADRVAEEAELRMWHMRLVESFVAVTGQYVREKPTVERFAETLLLLWNTLTLIKGQIPFPQPRLGAQVAYLTVGEPISVSDRWPAYRQNRRQGIADLTQDLQTALEALIHG